MLDRPVRSTAPVRQSKVNESVSPTGWRVYADQASVVRHTALIPYEKIRRGFPRSNRAVPASRCSERTEMIRVDEAQVTLTIPADPAYVRLVRLVVASSASDLGYAYEGVEDVRIVADEAANLAIGACRPGGAVRVGIFSLDRTIAVCIECPTDKNHAEFDPLASQIVAALTTACSVSTTDGELRVYFQCPPAPK